MPHVDLQPPCESPIEEHFAWAFTKYMHPSTLLRTQVPVSTICGEFRPDFVATSSSGLRVAYECDGTEFHNTSRDEWRDAMILGDGHVDAIVRIPGAEINFRIHDVIYVASRWDPNLFSDRGHTNLHRLTSRSALAFDLNLEPDFAVVCYRGDEMQSPGPMYLRMTRTPRIVPPGQRRFWQTAYKFAKMHHGGDLDEVIAAYRSSNENAM
jgi:hypothetical protein